MIINIVIRFEDAMGAAQLAVRLDSNNREASIVARKTRAVAKARLNGNELFKTGRFSEACVAYGEGLEHDPYNAVLLCNRAACRTKLGQHEKALEDCNSALNIRPYFSKARLRRGNCLAKVSIHNIMTSFIYIYIYMFESSSCVMRFVGHQT